MSKKAKKKPLKASTSSVKLAKELTQSQAHRLVANMKPEAREAYETAMASQIEAHVQKRLRKELTFALKATKKHLRASVERGIKTVDYELCLRLFGHRERVKKSTKKKEDVGKFTFEKVEE